MKPRNSVGRREFLKRAGMAAAGLGLIACAPAATPSPTPTKAPAATPAANATAAKPAASPAALKPADVRAQLYELAKKEGQAVIYATGTSKDMDTYRQAFSKTYPGVEIKEWMGTNESITEKMTTEAKAGKTNADLFILPMAAWGDVIKGNLAEKWDTPERANYPSDAVDPNGVWVLEHAAVHVISYNTQLVPAADAPKNYQDLLNPVFKGKLGLESESYSLFTQRVRVWGKEKTVDYFKKLAAQQPKLIKGHTTLADAVVSGEVWAAVNVFQHRVEELKGKGAPVKWVVDEPTGSEPQGVAITKGAPHPNAGKLLMDWLLSEEGQIVVYKDLKRYTARKGSSMPPELQVKVAFHGPDIADELAANVKVFKEIFGMI